MEREHWAERLAGAAARFPWILTDSMARRLVDLPRRVEAAVTSLRHGPACSIHGDAHLDNVLFRVDGTAVLIDWSGAAMGPPALDLARLLTEGIDAGGSEDETRMLVAEYLGELAASGVMGAADDVWPHLPDGVALLAQAAVGWAGREEEREPRERMRALQENLLRSVCAWATNAEMAARGHVFGPSAQA
jgi:Ser/Thr protein kinase RdoA (MazF antagonist)